jgi:hypothetical protein
VNSDPYPGKADIFPGPAIGSFPLCVQLLYVEDQAAGEVPVIKLGIVFKLEGQIISYS